MTLLVNNIPKKSKGMSHHPWERTVKDFYSHYFKRAHNSINNPQYPTKKNTVYNKDRVKFTIIGNRATKEFIYCTHLANVLHKYRQKTFDTPSIRGVTSVEWPKIWNELKIKYGGLTYCLEGQVIVLLNDRFLGGEKELKETVESRYNYHVTLDYNKEGIQNFANFIETSGRPCAYMQITIHCECEYTGSLIFMLYSDIVPYTCENFLRLCQTKKGGYSGTPVHRIVKDGWIQCGGFGLKSSELDCENFIIPHDRRGVLCMANDGRHVDCSTQFFVLLQPAPWMDQKYVAFGQLIDGEATLKAIESVSTFYESPEHEIIIERAGILNLDYQDIIINKNTYEYLHGHIEDLVALGDLLYEQLLEKTFLEIELRQIALLEMTGEGEETNELQEDKTNIHPTERFIRKKEDLEQLQKSQTHASRVSSIRASSILAPSMKVLEEENNEFDVDEYQYEAEEYYTHMSIAAANLVVKPEKPFYLPFTDVTYPGEVDSTYDLKKFLRGDYCLESDLEKYPQKKVAGAKMSFISEIYKLDDHSEITSVESLSSEEEQEIRRYIKLNVDRVSFAGDVIRSIARGICKYNIFEGTGKSDLITDEELRRLKVASVDRRSREAHDKKVSISLPSTKREPNKIKRRQTGFVRPEDLEKIYVIHKSRSHDIDSEEDDESFTGSRKVRIAESAIATQTGTKPVRKPTGFPRSELTESDADVRRKSALSRLYDNMIDDDDEFGPTLKDYKPTDQKSQRKTFILTQSPIDRIVMRSKDTDSPKDKYLRQSITIDDSSIEQVLNLQHSRKTARKISSDYVKTIDQIEHRNENSIRSVEFAKTRPSLTVSEYQQKNLKHQEDIKNAKLREEKSPIKESDDKQYATGLRLPGDTPLYSLTDIDEPRKK